MPFGLDRAEAEVIGTGTRCGTRGRGCATVGSFGREIVRLGTFEDSTGVGGRGAG